MQETWLKRAVNRTPTVKLRLIAPKQSAERCWKKTKTTLHRAESCSMSLCHYQRPHCSCSDIDLCSFKGVICEKWPEFEGSFKTVWGQRNHLLLLTPSIATFGYCCTFIKELRCGCTLDWDWTQPLRWTDASLKTEYKVQRRFTECQFVHKVCLM